MSAEEIALLNKFLHKRVVSMIDNPVDIKVEVTMGFCRSITVTMILRKDEGSEFIFQSMQHDTTSPLYSQDSFEAMRLSVSVSLDRL